MDAIETAELASNEILHPLEIGLSDESLAKAYSVTPRYKLRRLGLTTAISSYHVQQPWNSKLT